MCLVASPPLGAKPSHGAKTVKPLLVFRLSLLVFRGFFVPPGVPVSPLPLLVFRCTFYSLSVFRVAPRTLVVLRSLLLSS